MGGHAVVGQFAIPSWIVKAFITAIIGVLVTGAAAWGVNLSRSRADHEKRIAVVEDHQKSIDKSLDEIKSMQRTQAEDTKKILERLPRR